VEENAFFMEAITGVICLTLGVRLCWSGRRSTEHSKTLIGLTLLIWALGYALYDIPYAFTRSDESTSRFFSYASMLSFNLGNVVLAIYTQEVFRKQEKWAGWLVVAVAICMLLGSAGSAWTGDWEQVDPFDNPGYWPQTMANLLPAFWLGYEGLSQGLRARGRLALGFIEPIDRHRMLLLGLIGTLWLLLETVIVVQDFIYINVGDWSGMLGIANGLLEIVPMSMLWLAFFPPAPYRRWIEATVPA
jgi:hypothetical protein